MSLRSRLFSPFSLALCLFSIALTTAVAQVDRGAIVDTITDQTRAVVLGVQVVVTNVSTNPVSTVTTDDQGNYTASLLRIGTYAVEAEKSGFQKTLMQAVDVAVNQTIGSIIPTSACLEEDHRSRSMFRVVRLSRTRPRTTAKLNSP